MKKKLFDKFAELFGSTDQAHFYFSPGRVNLIGCDVNELCPPCDPTGASTAGACKIIREMLIAVSNRGNI